jgi:hypothetical protein
MPNKWTRIDFDSCYDYSSGEIENLNKRIGQLNRERIRAVEQLTKIIHIYFSNIQRSHFSFPPPLCGNPWIVCVNCFFEISLSSRRRLNTDELWGDTIHHKGRLRARETGERYFTLLICAAFDVVVQRKNEMSW